MINLNERTCLVVLRLAYESDDNFCNFRGVEVATGFDRRVVKRAVRGLARKGFAEYGKGLWCDDGPAGAGYCCTKAGAEFLDGGL